MTSSDPEIVGYIGQDILGSADVEFDLAHDRLAFYQPKDCAKADLIYWSPNFSLAPLRRRDPALPHFATTVVVNGKAMQAMISTTTRYSTMDLGPARSVGVTPQSPGVRRVARFDVKPQDAWVGVFTSVAIGDEQVKNVSLTFSDLWSQARATETGSRLAKAVEGFPPLVLGQDFLRAHRLLLATSQGRMYMTYNGGGIFKTAPPAN